jgi:hypothetical protein
MWQSFNQPAASAHAIIIPHVSQQEKRLLPVESTLATIPGHPIG